MFTKLSHFQKFANYPNAAWPTRVVCYPLGAKFAHLVNKMGLTPNQVSLIGALIAVIAVCYVIFFKHNSFLEGALLVLGLESAYVMDCADGVLARATNRASAYGAILDKLCDGFQTLCLPLLLLYGQSTHFHDWNGAEVVILAFFYATSSTLLTNALWFSAVYKKPDLVITANSSHSWLHRSITTAIDSPTLRLALGTAWAFQVYIPFLIILSCFNLIVFCGYLKRLHAQSKPA